MTPAQSSILVRINQRASSRAAGFTLLEMLLVLAILVAITAVTIPVVGRMYDTHRIQQAAMEVRTTLSAARLRAVDEGEAFECRFEPDGRHLVILPRRDQGIRFGGEEVSSHSADQLAAEAIHVELPEPLYFWTADDARERLEDRAIRKLANGNLLGDRTWSAPVVFAPNGTSTSAEFEIRDREGRAVQLEVRGLTGAASASTLVKRSDA
ncbi:MAG: type II secretion system protein [Planctomycetota bacterium]|nr:type II secretion system protein [Planctomycetota bacterium]